MKVLIIYPDTNALHADLLMLRTNSQKLVRGLLEGQVEVVLSPVVVVEAQRRTNEAAQETIAGARSALRDIERKHGVRLVEADTAITDLLARVERTSDQALAPLLAHEACKVLPWPEVESKELVMREIDRRPPTRVKGDQSIGLRDTIIWHGLVEFMRHLDDDDIVLFITSDGGFLHDGALSPSLAKELDEEFINPEQLRVVGRLESALVEVEERRDLVTRQEGLIRQAVINHLASFDGQTWSAVDRGGEAPLRYGIEEGLVVAVDSITIERAAGTPPTAVNATAEITISGYMRSDEYMHEYSDFVEWMHGEIYDPMIGVDFTATIALEAEVQLSDDGDEAWISDETLTWIE